MTGLTSIGVYEWQAWDLFLIGHLVDPALRVTARYDDPADVLAPLVEAGVAAILPQIDLSHSAAFPRRRSEILDYCRAHGLAVLNGGVQDIRKRSLHSLLAAVGLPSTRAEAQGAPDDWLFVKSNLNAGGKREAHCEITRAEDFGYSAEAPIQRADGYYRVLRNDVAPQLWDDPSVVIERYIENPEHSFYRVYRFGDAVVVVKGHSRSPIKKLSGHSQDRNHLVAFADLVACRTGLPQGLNAVLATFLERTGLAYCCIDVVHDETGFYIIDLNLTPYSGTPDENPEILAFLREGAELHVTSVREVDTDRGLA